MSAAMLKEPRTTLPVGRTMKAAHLAARTIPNDEIVKAGELVEARFARGVAPSAAARKVMALLFHQAAGDAWKSGPHCIKKKDLRGSHGSTDRIDGIFDELQRTLLRLPTTTPDGRPGAVIVPVMAYRIEHLEQDDRSMIWFEFTPQAREVLQQSDYYAALNRGVVLALESRYACTLYERGCLLVSRRHPMWRGSVDDLREVMGIQTGRYQDWADIRRKVVEPAVAEVNQIAHFTVTYRVETGPRNKVTAIEFWFQLKDVSDGVAAEREREASRIGRKARRKGSVERTVSVLDLPPLQPSKGD
jgi:Initiator Replication protein